MSLPAFAWTMTTAPPKNMPHTEVLSAIARAEIDMRYMTVADIVCGVLSTRELTSKRARVCPI
eukprot:779441-Pleurochrysis_carterae.AAC.1